MTSRILLFPLLFSTLTAAAQNGPIGTWRSHLPYNIAQDVVSDGQKNYVITEKAFFIMDVAGGGGLETFSKVSGMHDTNPVALSLDKKTGVCVIGYSSTNIDLYKKYRFKVLPDLKNKSFSGSKSIRNIFSDNGLAYVSTGLGVIVIDLAKEEVKSTYTFSKNGQAMAINAFIADTAWYYAASEGGLYRIARTATAPQVFANWQPVDTQRNYNRLAIVGSALFAATSGFTDTLYRINGPGSRQRIWYRDSTSITSLDGIGSVLYAGVFTKGAPRGKMYHFSMANAIVDSTSVASPKGLAATDDGRLWLADGYLGLGKRIDDGSLQYFVPNGPNSPVNVDIYAHNGEVWTVHGNIYPTLEGQKQTTGISRHKDYNWENFDNSFPLFRDSVFDFMVVKHDDRSGNLYFGSHSSGIYERKPDGSGRIIKQGALFSNAAGEYPAMGIAFDGNGNMWVNQSRVNPELAVRSADGQWGHYYIPKYDRIATYAGVKMVVDDYNQKWYVVPYGGGVIVFDENNADGPRNLKIGKGYGDLPSNNTLSIVKDRDGAIWIGTTAGIAIFNSPSIALTDRTSDAEQRVVQYDQFAGKLFSNESVTAMAVDGANRKWIGTTNGVWLLSPDANKIISRFTVDNSPLPSNIIDAIAVDDVTGDVYFSTPDGLVSYRGTATEGASTAGSIQTFPSPIAADYQGPITMRGFTTDADVRITDVAGQLIYKAKAAGGTLVWNGLDYTGNRPHSGVLLIFATNKDGSQAAVGKMIIMN